MKTPKPNDPPNLAVIDLALWIIRNGYPTKYTCHAIEAAVLAVEFGVTLSRAAAPGFRLTDCQMLRMHLYRKQYTMFAVNLIDDISWWNSSQPFKERRIAALKAFRKACIAAGKTKTTERIAT
jgi:hypothetical protein